MIVRSKHTQTSMKKKDKQDVPSRLGRVASRGIGARVALTWKLAPRSPWDLLHLCSFDPFYPQLFALYFP